MALLMTMLMTAMNGDDGSSISKAIARAQAEPGMKMVVRGFGNSSESNTVSGAVAGEREAEEKSTSEHWLDVLTTLTLRWYTEIIA